jgi:hypothetical protein
MQSPHGMELASPPSDGISSVRFAGHADLLLVASWDSHVRLYDATLNSLRVAFKQRAPVLDAAFMVRKAAFKTPQARRLLTRRARRTRTPPSAAAWTRPCASTTSTARWRRRARSAQRRGGRGTDSA